MLQIDWLPFASIVALFGFVPWNFHPGIAGLSDVSKKRQRPLALLWQCSKLQSLRTASLFMLPLMEAKGVHPQLVQSFRSTYVPS